MYHIADYVSRSFVGGYRSGQQVIRREGVNSYGTGGLRVQSRFPLGKKPCSVRTGLGRIFCPFLIKSVVFIFGQIKHNISLLIF
jgi:hypothetical protein